jgi:hypothetical protein
MDAFNGRGRSLTKDAYKTNGENQFEALIKTACI